MAERSRADYAGIITKIEKEFSDFPLAGIDKEPEKGARRVPRAARQAGEEVVAAG